MQGISSDEFDEALRQAYEKYGDILSRPHPVSKTHPPMARGDRAAQFAPFAALAGFEEAIRHAQKEYEKQMGGEGGKRRMTKVNREENSNSRYGGAARYPERLKFIC